MGVPLSRAWEICAILDDADDDGRWDYELTRAAYLTDPAVKAQQERRDRRAGRPIDTATVIRDRARRRSV